MAEGQLRCAGSSLFLKKMYGVGYQLTIEKNVSGRSKVTELKQRAFDKLSDDSEVLTDPVSSAPMERTIYDIEANTEYEAHDGCADCTWTSLVKASVPEATLLNDVGTEVRYQLPIGSSDKFATMFEQLDREVDRGDIVSYGVSITTLGTLARFSALYAICRNISSILWLTSIFQPS
jgi:ATP-binding cassette, subfamily A (ABC1), member 3